MRMVLPSSYRLRYGQSRPKSWAEAYVDPVNDLQGSIFDAVSHFDALFSYLVGLSRYFLDVFHTITYLPK